MSGERQDSLHSRRRTSQRKLAIPVILILLTLGIGVVGVYQDLSTTSGYQELPQVNLLLESFFIASSFLVLNTGPYPILGGETPILVYVSRGTGALFFSYAALIAFGALFADRLKPLRIQVWHHLGSVRREGDSGHIIVCGLGQKGFQLASRLLEEGHQVVAIEIEESTSRVRELDDRGAIILSEDSTRRRTVGERAKVHLASEVFVNCGKDRTNAKVVESISEWLIAREAESENSGVLDCHVQIGERTQRHFLHDRLEETPSLRLHSYDTYHATARELLRRRPVDRVTEQVESRRTHVVVIGWNPLSRAVIFELCQLMHYRRNHDREITVICQEPESARTELLERHAALDSNRWDDASTQSFVERLFPNIEFIDRPVDEDLATSEQFGLRERLQPAETMTMIVTGSDWYQSGSFISKILPRLEAWERELDLDTSVQYFVDADDEPGRETRLDTLRVQSDTVDISPFTAFVDECTPETVRGERRDRVAKQLAFFFYLRYDYSVSKSRDRESSVDAALTDRLPVAPPEETGYSYETVVGLWEQLEQPTILELADKVWQELSEHYRDTNRNAADHIPVKRRIAASMAPESDRETLLDQLAETEHRRWSAEKFLDGWEPLDAEFASAWRTEEAKQAEFRAQKFHLDLRPLAELERVTEGEAEKDHSLVKFVLDDIYIEKQEE